MKKKYITPACIVMKMELENTLLSLSQGEPGNPNVGQKPEYIPDEGAGGNYWDVD